MVIKEQTKSQRIDNYSDVPWDALVDDEAAKYLGMDLDEFYEWFVDGEIPGVRVGDRLYFRKTILDSIINLSGLGFQPF